jgi:tetratricopeptide (TPR) repeat protein
MKRRYIISAVCLVALSILALWADEDVARVLLKKGDEALQKNDFPKAIEFYKKALHEQSNLPEVYFSLANVYTKAGDKRRARRNFEECIRLVKALPKPSSSQQMLQKEATNRLNSLDKGRQELSVLEKKYVEQSLIMAKRFIKKDIPLAESILRNVLYLTPANAEAAKLLKDIKDVRVFEAWQALFNGQDLTDWQPQEPSLWKVESRILACDTERALTNRRQKLSFDKEYKLRMEFRVSQMYHELGSIGIILGDKNKEGDLTSLSVFKDAVKLIGFRGGQGKDIREESVPESFKITEWNTLALEISYGIMKVYLNDKLMFEHRADKDEMLQGGTGIWLQRVNAEIRKMEYLK